MDRPPGAVNTSGRNVKHESDSTRGDAVECAMASFMYVFWAPKHLVSAPRSPAQAAESGLSWRAFEEALRKGGHAPTGAELEAGGNCVTKAGLTAGAFPGEHVMGGYFIVDAKSLEEATELAQGCPLVANGGTVEVRPLMTHP